MSVFFVVECSRVTKECIHFVNSFETKVKNVVSFNDLSKYVRNFQVFLDCSYCNRV